MKNLLSQLSKESLVLVRSIGVLAQDKGVNAYLVGGPVRDLLLKRPTLDLDIVVEGNASRLVEAFAAQHPGAKLQVYQAFKTATVHLPDGRLVDFATARQEKYVRPGAFPAVVPSDMKHDLFRRDFTINAMAVHITPDHWGKMVDPYGGYADLKAKKIRVLHAQSFIDDPTRIVRAARFKARLGFTMEQGTIKLLKAAVKAKALDTIKPQRYLKEFNKILKEDSVKTALKYLKSWDALKEVVYATHGKS